MGFTQIGIPGLILIVIILLVIFGPKKLPEFGKAAGQTLKEFKNSTNDLISEHEKDEKDAKMKLKKISPLKMSIKKQTTIHKIDFDYTERANNKRLGLNLQS